MLRNTNSWIMFYSFDPPLRNLHVKKTGVLVQRPRGPKKYFAPEQDAHGIEHSSGAASIEHFHRDADVAAIARTCSPN